MNNENILSHFELLGKKVTDKVTGFSGVVSSLSFDLYGCIQVTVQPEYDRANNKHLDARWYDVTRLSVSKKKPVMEQPRFDLGYVSEGKKGAAEKPLPG